MTVLSPRAVPLVILLSPLHTYSHPSFHQHGGGTSTSCSLSVWDSCLRTQEAAFAFYLECWRFFFQPCVYHRMSHVASHWAESTSLSLYHICTFPVLHGHNVLKQEVMSFYGFNGSLHIYCTGSLMPYSCVCVARWWERFIVYSTGQ